MSVEIGLSRVHFPVTALGPGQRIGIWFQGCSIRCPGCMSLDTWAPARTTQPVLDLLARLRQWLPLADGITISGGEPFDQPAALHALLALPDVTSAASVLVYSGYSLQQLQQCHPYILPLIDVLITEPFDQSKHEHVLLRGSSNQQVACLTDRGAELWRSAELARNRSGTVDVIVDDDGELWFAGIPKPGDIARLSNGLARAGVRANSSAGKLGSTS